MSLCSAAGFDIVGVGTVGVISIDPLALSMFTGSHGLLPLEANDHDWI